MTSRSLMRLRIAILGCAVLLAVQAAWMLLPDILLRVNERYPESAPPRATSTARAAAELAARLGVVRGDLWAEVALTYNDLAWPLNRDISQLGTRRDFEGGQAAVKRALRSSPHDARLWLLLAALDVQLERLGGQRIKETIDALKMAYYTAPNEVELSPYRLMVAVRPGMLADEELQQLVRNELRVVVTQKPQLKSAVLAAYREASPAAKSIFEDVARIEDPNLLEADRSATGVR